MSNLSSSQSFTEKYFPILCADPPDFLQSYVGTPAMQRLDGTGVSCGMNYTKLYKTTFLYSNLAHSIGVALVVWRFTHDKKATLAGLFHDISTPAFKHCVDFMNGDHERQESIEDLTEDFIKNSPEIMRLLQRDNIKVAEVADYKRYPIADNDTPQLSADRLEYTLSYGVFWLPIWNLRDIKTIYDDLAVLQNEENLPEIGFKTPKIAEKFVQGASQLWPTWRDNKNSITMQFLADTLKKAQEIGEITLEDLFNLSEKAVLEKLQSSGDHAFVKDLRKFLGTTTFFESESKPKDKYHISLKSKIRYIVPLAQTASGAQRITDLSPVADQIVKSYLALRFPKYAYFNFDCEKIGKK
jgi:HD superfamily phosphohydrolase